MYKLQNLTWKKHLYLWTHINYNEAGKQSDWNVHMNLVLQSTCTGDKWTPPAETWLIWNEGHCANPWESAALSKSHPCNPRNLVWGLARIQIGFGETKGPQTLIWTDERTKCFPTCSRVTTLLMSDMKRILSKKCFCVVTTYNVWLGYFIYWFDPVPFHL